MKAYVTLLSTDAYLEGVLCLALSLRATSTTYPLYVLLTPGVSERVWARLAAFDLPTLSVGTAFSIPEAILTESSRPNWKYTFAKLAIFELTQFERLVFLDADLLITASIDRLFDEVHAASVVYHGRLPPYAHWNFPNSGVLVVHPQEGLGKKIFADWPAVAAQTKTFSDQDLIHRFYAELYREKYEEWDLPIRYNTCVFMIDKVCRAYNLNVRFNTPDERTVAVLHFSSTTKPWMMSVGFRANRYIRKAVTGKWGELRAYYHYFGYLRKVRRWLNHLARQD